MGGVFLGAALLALILTVLLVGVVRLTAMVARRLWGRSKDLTAERCFAEAVAAGDFHRAEQQAALLLEPPPGPGVGSSPQFEPKREGEPQGGSALLLPPLWSPLLRKGRCVHGMAGGCRACRGFGRGWGVA